MRGRVPTRYIKTPPNDYIHDEGYYSIYGGENTDKIVRCEKCGAMVKVLIDCTCENCGIKCCGEVMKEISAEDADKYLEKK